MEKENEKGLSTCIKGNLLEDDIFGLDKISLDENFVKVVKLTNSLVNKLYNKPTTKEKVFLAVFVLNKDNLKSLYDKIQYKLGLHNIQDTEFAIYVLGVDEKDNKQSTEYMSIDEFLNTNDTKSLLTKLVVMEWKTKLFLNNSRTPISKIIGEEFNIEIAISSAPKDSSDEAYFIFNDYPIKTKGIIQVSVVHSNQVIADELIQHVGDFVSGIEDKRIKKDSFIYNHKREIAQSAEKILGIPALIPLVHLFFNINSCLNSTNSIIKLISICMGFFILSITFGNTIGELIYNLLNKRKSTSWIILNDYTKQEYEKYKSYSNPAIKAFFLYLLPIILNIFSAIISQNIGN